MTLVIKTMKNTRGECRGGQAAPLCNSLFGATKHIKKQHVNTINGQWERFWGMKVLLFILVFFVGLWLHKWTRRY